MDRTNRLQEIVAELEQKEVGHLLRDSEVSAIAEALGVSVEAVLGEEASLTAEEALESLHILDRVQGVEHDLKALPLGEGDLLPDAGRLACVEAAFEDNTAVDTFVDETFIRFELEGLGSVSQFFNAFKVPSSEFSEVMWDFLREDTRTAAALDLIASGMTEMKPEVALQEICNKLMGRPAAGIHGKIEAEALTRAVLRGLSRAFSRRLIARLRVQPMQLLPDGEILQDVQAFCTSLELSMDFEQMDLDAYHDMLANPLGQAQTADTSAAESYFRSREGHGSEVQNNFGYVYLTQEQANVLELDEGTSVRPFWYMAERYMAIPVGLYFMAKNLAQYEEVILKLTELAESSPGTPVEEYYKDLIAYYEFASLSPLRGDEFLTEYYELCYEAERAWVRYVRYVLEKGLPMVHIHPFERYGTKSTRSHDLSLALVNPKETGIFMEAKAQFMEGAKNFLNDSGLVEKFPVMAEQSLRHMDSAVMVSLSARLHSAIPGTLAQNIPDEEAGKKEGIVTLFDTDFSRGTIPAFRGTAVRDRDALGGLSKLFDEAVADPQRFMDHYMLFIVGHELNHNMWKGKKRPTEGTKDGLSINTIEEAKASQGMALMFEDPRHLKPQELQQLRGALPLIIPWMLTRLNPKTLKDHRSAPYLREAASLMDHMLKSGILDVKRLCVDEKGFEERPVEGAVAENEFEFLQYDLSDAVIQDYIARCVDFIERLAPDYQQAEFDEVPAGHVIPDWTHVDTWQALSRACYDRDLKSAKTDEARVAIETEKAAIKVGPPEIEEKVRALLRYADKEQIAQIRSALKVGRGLGEEGLEAFKAYVLAQYPQIVNG